MKVGIDGHTISERTNLLIHCQIAALVDAAPDLLKAARRRIDEIIEATGGTEGERMWQKALRGPWCEAREQMIEDGHAGRLLRSNTPFAAVLEPMDEDVRRRLWKQAKAELEAELATSPDEFFERQVWLREFVHRGKAARDHLAAGRSIAITREDTPPGCVIRIYPDGREELEVVSPTPLR